MKKIMITVATALFVSGINAQSIYDATKIASKDLNGTARFVGMGGAMMRIGWGYFHYGHKSGRYRYLSQ